MVSTSHSFPICTSVTQQLPARDGETMNPILIPMTVICLICTPSVTTYKAVNEPLPTKVILSEYDIKLDQWINSLAKCESGNNEKAIHKNDGGSDSIGYVQYKSLTFTGYTKKFDLAYVPEDIWSKEAQIAVTKEVIKNEPNGWKNWYNCVTKHGVGLPPKNAS